MLFVWTLWAQLAVTSKEVPKPVPAPVTCILANGDRLSGSLRSVGRSTIRLRHPSLGTVTLKRRVVRWCESDDPVVVRRMHGLALPSFGVRPMLLVEQAPTPQLMELVAERPLPKESFSVAPVAMPLAARALPTYSARVGWKRQLALNYAVSRGNASASNLGFSGSATRRLERTQVALTAKRQHGVSNGTVSTDFFSTTLRYDAALGPNNAGAATRPSFFSESTYEHDPIALVKRRMIEGVGFSIPLSPDPKNNLALEVGGGVTHERFTNDDQRTRGSAIFRLAARQQFGLAKADQQIAAFPELGGSDSRSLVNTDLNFAAPLNKILALKLGITHRYNTRPQATVKKSDFGVQSGLGFEF